MRRVSGALACVLAALACLPPPCCSAGFGVAAGGSNVQKNPEAESLEAAGAGALELPDAEGGADGAGGAGGARRTRASHDAWMQLLAEYARPAAAAAARDEGWFPRPIPVSLPLGRGASMPMLILPVPVPAPESTQCSSGGAPDARRAEEQIAPPPAPWPLTGGRGATPTTSQAASHAAPHAAPHASPQAPARQPLIRDEPAPPQLDYIVSSQQLVELFQAQVEPDPELPPVLVPEHAAGGAAYSEHDEPAERGVRRTRQLRLRRYQPPGPPRASPPPRDRPADAPPAPRLDRSLVLRGELTVPRAGFTAPYTVWWDARTGASRVDVHGGATSAYRMILADGRVQDVQIGTDRSGGGEVRRCAVGTPRAPSPADLAVPAFPDMEEFSFAGYADEASGVERWTRTVLGRAGELGGVRGEALTFRHEVLAVRAPDNYTATPLRYSVAVDSSVLGANCDSYVHRYTDLRYQPLDPELLRLDTGEACEAMQTEARRHAVQPLREYTLSSRDPRYDDDFQQFKSEHARRYMDDTEEAVRKNLMMQTSRFVDSGNTQGATFSMEVNYLGDRLNAELSRLYGVEPSAEAIPAERFPHSRDQLGAIQASLPRAFDWRQRGAVTHVRSQGSCSSCWAFAVTGAVEGALFVRTRRLVPLSEQCLVDCAGPFGGHGCRGTWPSAAYDYVQERGLPALSHYTPYQGRELTCLEHRVPPVTRISAHVNVTKLSVPALKVAIRRHAPTVVIVGAAKSFITYKKGVLYDDRCPKNKAEHAVLAVGWAEHGGEPHFVLKNSWGAVWGEEGYVRVAAGGNTCGVLSRPSYPRLERRDLQPAVESAPTEP